VRTRDAYGAWSAYSSAAFVRIDTVPPTTVASFASPPPIVGGLAMLAGPNRILLTAADTGSGAASTAYSVNGGPSTPYAGPFLPIGHGIATIAYASVDLAGNTEPARILVVLLDAEPTVAPTAPADGSWTNGASVTVSWAFADPEGDGQSAFEAVLAQDAGFTQVAQTSGVVTSGGASHAFRGVADGSYYWRVRAADVYGAWSSFSGYRSISVDRVAPLVSPSWSESPTALPPDLAWVHPGATLTLTATDSGSGLGEVELSIDGVISLYLGPVAFTDHGVHDVLYWGTDAAGNEGPRNLVRLLVDVEPSASNLIPANGAWVVASPLLSWAFSDTDGDPQGSYELEVSPDPTFASVAARSGRVDASGSEWTVPGLADGTYYWRVRVRDSFGVASTWSSETAFRLDATPPQTSLTHEGRMVSPGAWTVEVGDALTLAAVDAGSGVDRVEYALDGGGWTPYAGPLSFGEAGRHALRVRATDVAGTSAEQFYLIDVRYPMNWTPVFALVLAASFVVLGYVIGARRARPGTSKTVAWARIAIAPLLAEAGVAGYSLVSGDLSMPPWFGAGSVVVILIAIAGVVAAPFARGPRVAAPGSLP
jgi:hypothetical protein